MKPIILYHGACSDGFGAAWAAACYFGPEDAQYVAAYDRDRPSEVEIQDGAVVYILDFSYPRDVMEALARRCRVIVIDHHDTAERALAGLRGADVVFDQTRSGAYLTWRHFFPEYDVPAVLRYVDAGDRWRFDLLPRVREVYAVLSATPNEFDAFTRLNEDLERDVEAVARHGAPVIAAQDRATENALRRTILAEVAGHIVPVCNTTSEHSWIGHRLIEQYPDAPFSATWYQADADTQKWSLRGNGQVNVARIAELFGGGGHPNAAGFRLRREVDLTVSPPAMTDRT